MVSSSCSTTMSVLPMSRRFFIVLSSFALSRWCRPMLGSSRMYSTPMSEEPICVASRMRCASPPESVAAARESVRYCRPTLCKKPRRLRISLMMRPAIIACISVSCGSSASRKRRHSVTGRSQNSEIFIPPTVTARTSFRRRRPPQSGQGVSAMHCSISARMAGLCVSR